MRICSIESTLAEFLHATTASIPVPAVRSYTKRARGEAGLPSSPAPLCTSEGIDSDIPRAEELILGAASPSPYNFNICALAALCADEELMAEPTVDPDATMAPPQPKPTAAKSTGKPRAAAPQAQLQLILSSAQL